MANGYVRKLLFVDLTAGTVTEETRDGCFYRKWIGGTGPAAGTAPPPFEVLREGYREAMGWDCKTGWLNEETLAALGVA